MECICVKTTSLGIIECVSIYPCTHLPGFFELWLDREQRRLINGGLIKEIIEHEPEYFAQSI